MRGNSFILVEESDPLLTPSVTGFAFCDQRASCACTSSICNAATSSSASARLGNVMIGSPASVSYTVKPSGAGRVSSMAGTLSRIGPDSRGPGMLVVLAPGWGRHGAPWRLGVGRYAGRVAATHCSGRWPSQLSPDAFRLLPERRYNRAKKAQGAPPGNANTAEVAPGLQWTGLDGIGHKKGRNRCYY